MSSLSALSSSPCSAIVPWTKGAIRDASLLRLFASAIHLPPLVSRLRESIWSTGNSYLHLATGRGSDTILCNSYPNFSVSAVCRWVCFLIDVQKFTQYNSSAQIMNTFVFNNGNARSTTVYERAYAALNALRQDESDTVVEWTQKFT